LIVNGCIAYKLSLSEFHRIISSIGSYIILINSKILGSYKVEFINDLDKQIKEINITKSVIIIDQKVLNLFSEKFIALNGNSRLVIIESNEKNKSIDYCQKIIRDLIALNIRKDDLLIAIGGGITQDIVAFISSVLFRGIKWVFFPTTLLAQCDSCIGSKSSINFDSYKNLLGTFNPPINIYIYKGFLKTLSHSEIRSGIGEMLHYFLTEGIILAEQVTNRIDILLENRNELDYFIKNSLRIKKQIIEIDEFDQSIRHIFNYGHTFGHAIEAITNYTIPHGQAITLGMDLANYISLKLDLLNRSQFNQMHEILLTNMPAYEFNANNILDYLNALSITSKNESYKPCDEATMERPKTQSSPPLKSVTLPPACCTINTPPATSQGLNPYS
jgi:3-dehydroquinate synthase